MTQTQKYKLLEAMYYCDVNDKSTEFMLQYMQDFAGVDLDTVVDFMSTTKAHEHIEYMELRRKNIKEVNQWYE